MRHRVILQITAFIRAASRSEVSISKVYRQHTKRIDSA